MIAMKHEIWPNLHSNVQIHYLKERNKVLEKYFFRQFRQLVNLVDEIDEKNIFLKPYFFPLDNVSGRLNAN